MDIISCSQSKINKTESTSNTINNYLRYRDIKTYNKHARDIFEFMQAYPNITFRYFFKSSKPLSGGLDEMKFDPEIMGPMVEIGKEDAARMVGQPRGESFKRFNSWYQSKALRQQHPHFEDYMNL
jgi:hypothetical protein